MGSRDNTPATAATVFLTGGTGYIGGTVLQRLIDLPDPPSLITVLVRERKKAELLAKLTLPSGVVIEPLFGSLQDLDTLTDAAGEHSVVISAANSDDMPSIKALLRGMRARKEKTGQTSVFIHTSGTGLLADDAKGMYAGDIVYTDLDAPAKTGGSPALHSLDELSDTALHRNVDLAIVAADAAGDCESYIVVECSIWGEPRGQVFELGIAKSFTLHFAGLIRTALDRGQAGMVGEGRNIWNHVNINDVGHLYGLVYIGALQGDIGHGKDGFYFATGGEFDTLSVVKVIGACLAERWWIKNSEPSSYTHEELLKYFSGFGVPVDFFGVNSRGVSQRSESIGWKPKYTELSDLLEGVRSEVVHVGQSYGLV